jgi:hypothetical protein
MADRCWCRDLPDFLEPLVQQSLAQSPVAAEFQVALVQIQHGLSRIWLLYAGA